MTSETEKLTHTVEGTSTDGDLEHSLEIGLLKVLRTFRGVSEGNATVSVFTDSTPGHIWEISMEKQAEAGETVSFRFCATHLPPPCNPHCEPEPVHVAESGWLNKVCEVLVHDIAGVAREEAVPCCLA